MTHEPRHGNALLAPVPDEHLSSAVTSKLDRVAFGTNAYLVFRDEKGKRRISAGTPVLIYASRKDEASPAELTPHVTWEATFEEYRDAEDFSAEDLRRMRPPSTRTDTGAAGYWIVSGLTKLNSEEQRPIDSLRGVDNRIHRGFVPRQPMPVKA